MQAPRQIFIYEAIQEWKRNPLLGIGINSTKNNTLLKNNVTRYFVTDRVLESMTNVHNRFAETLLEAGLLGFIPLMGFLIILTFRHLRLFMKEHRSTSLILVLTHAAFWTMGLFQFSIWEAWIFMIFAVTLILNHAFMVDETALSRAST